MKGGDDLHAVGPENLQGLFVVLDGVMLVQLAHRFLIDLLEPDEDLPEPGLPQERNDLRVLDDGIAARLEGEALLDLVIDQELGDALGPGHAHKKIVIGEEDVLLRDGLDFLDDPLRALHPAFAVEEFPDAAEIAAVGTAAGRFHNRERLLETQVVMFAIMSSQMASGHGQVHPGFPPWAAPGYNKVRKGGLEPSPGTFFRSFPFSRAVIRSRMAISPSPTTTPSMEDSRSPPGIGRRGAPPQKQGPSGSRL